MARIKQQLEEAMVEIGGDGLDGSGSDRPAPEEQGFSASEPARQLAQQTRPVETTPALSPCTFSHSNQLTAGRERNRVRCAHQKHLEAGLLGCWFA
jgi:hypothetical protein